MKLGAVSQKKKIDKNVFFYILATFVQWKWRWDKQDWGGIFYQKFESNFHIESIWLGKTFDWGKYLIDTNSVRALLNLQWLIFGTLDHLIVQPCILARIRDDFSNIGVNGVESQEIFTRIRNNNWHFTRSVLFWRKSFSNSIFADVQHKFISMIRINFQIILWVD